MATHGEIIDGALMQWCSNSTSSSSVNPTVSLPSAAKIQRLEPLPAASPLRGLPNAILTPHMIGHTIEAHHSLEAATRENLARILSGRPPLYVVNPAVLPAWTTKWGSG